MENRTEKKNVFVRFADWYKAQYKEHPVRTVCATAGAAVATGAAVFGGVKLVKHLTAPKISDISGCNFVDDEVVRLTNLPDDLGFDVMKLVNKDGEVLADSIIDMGGDWVCADDWNLKNTLKTITDDTEAIQAALKEIAEEASVTVVDI